MCEVLSGDEVEAEDDDFDRDVERLFGRDSDDEHEVSHEEADAEAEMRHYRQAGDEGGGDRREPRPWRRRSFAVKSRRRVFARPLEPTKAQLEEHEVSHQPPASWCEFCVCAQGRWPALIGRPILTSELGTSRSLRWTLPLWARTAILS